MKAGCYSSVVVGPPKTVPSYSLIEYKCIGCQAPWKRCEVSSSVEHLSNAVSCRSCGLLWCVVCNRATSAQQIHPFCPKSVLLFVKDKGRRCVLSPLSFISLKKSGYKTYSVCNRKTVQTFYLWSRRKPRLSEKVPASADNFVVVVEHGAVTAVRGPLGQELPFHFEDPGQAASPPPRSAPGKRRRARKPTDACVAPPAKAGAEAGKKRRKLGVRRRKWVGGLLGECSQALGNAFDKASWRDLVHDLGLNTLSSRPATLPVAQLDSFRALLEGLRQELVQCFGVYCALVHEYTAYQVVLRGVYPQGVQQEQSVLSSVVLPGGVACEPQPGSTCARLQNLLVLRHYLVRGGLAPDFFGYLQHTQGTILGKWAAEVLALLPAPNCNLALRDKVLNLLSELRVMSLDEAPCEGSATAQRLQALLRRRLHEARNKLLARLPTLSRATMLQKEGYLYSLFQRQLRGEVQATEEATGPALPVSYPSFLAMLSLLHKTLPRGLPPEFDCFQSELGREPGRLAYSLLSVLHGLLAWDPLAITTDYCHGVLHYGHFKGTLESLALWEKDSVTLEPGWSDQGFFATELEAKRRLPAYVQAVERYALGYVAAGGEWCAPPSACWDSTLVSSWETFFALWLQLAPKSFPRGLGLQEQEEIIDLCDFNLL